MIASQFLGSLFGIECLEVHPQKKFLSWEIMNLHFNMPLRWPRPGPCLDGALSLSVSVRHQM